MTNKINIRNYNLPDSIIRQTEHIRKSSKTPTHKPDEGPSFKEILESQVNFSKHAGLRSVERNIPLGPEQINKLGSAVDKAEKKGIKDALIVMDGSAFIVNAGSRTVVTVMDQSEMKNNVFTNIDGAIFI